MKEIAVLRAFLRLGKERSLEMNTHQLCARGGSFLMIRRVPAYSSQLFFRQRHSRRTDICYSL